ncbi:hypothetical protein [Nocardia uniformis]|uniref:hypothetical protein n=1 Tax=Nocardia uniformis TaxID=53432 RepID=UPI001471DFFE|nr:hypothetical protein [Nocardia uniformis]
MGKAGTLVVIRGNSGSGKSTTAIEVQQRFGRGTCAVVAQDVVLVATTPHALFYSFDLTLDQTLIRHAGRPLAASIPESTMRQWYRGWQPLPFVDEVRIDADWSLDAIVDRIYRDVVAVR